MQGSKGLTAFYQGVLKKRRIVLALFALATVLLLWSARGLQWREDVLELLPDRDPTVKHYRDWMERFRPLDSMYLVVGAQDAQASVAQENIIAVLDFLGESMAAEKPELFREVTWKLEASTGLDAWKYIQDHRASYFTEKDLENTRDRLTTDSIRASLAGWRKTLIQTPSPYLGRILRRDPIGIDGDLGGVLQKIQGAAPDVQSVDSRLFHVDGRHGLILAEPAAPGTDSARARVLVDFMEGLMQEARAMPEAKSLRIAWLSGHRFSLENANRIKADLQRSLSLSITGIVLFVLLAFRARRYAFYALLPAAFGGAVAAGLARWLQPDISAISIGCGSMLAGISVDYGLHVLTHADSADPAPLERKMARLTRPLLLSAGTTALAFMVLRMSAMPGYRHLGLFAALAIAGALVFTLLALPIFARRAAGRNRGDPWLPLDKIGPRLLQLPAGGRGTVLALLIAISLAAIAGAARLEFEGDYEKLNGISRQSREDWEWVLKHFEKTLALTPVGLPGENLEELLQKQKRLDAFMRQQKEAGVLSGYLTVAALLPPPEEEKINRRRWQAFWTPERIAMLRARLYAALEEQGMRTAAFAPFFERLETPPEPLGYEDSPLRNITKPFFPGGRGEPLLLAQAYLSEKDQFATFQKRLKETLPDALTVDGETFMRYLVELIHRELRRMAGWSLLVISLFLLILMRSVKKTALLLLPLLLSALWTFGILGWLGVKINLMNSIVTIFIFGLVVDYSIFLFFSTPQKRGQADPHYNRTCMAVTLSACTTCMGLGSLALATHPALHSIGLTALFGILSGWAAVFCLTALLAGKRGPAR